MAETRLAIAFDRGDWGKLNALLENAAGLVDFIKIGPSVLLRLGTEAIQECRAAGIDVFLDLKLHDIPFQVAGAVTAAAEMGVALLTLQNSGGPAMLAEAVKAGSKAQANLRIIGVSVLTSLRDEDVLATYRAKPAELSLHLAGMAFDHGLDGIVCSGLELPVLRRRFPRPFLMVVPGLRFEGDIFGDQKRVVDPYNAVKNGADILVFGRSVTARPQGWDRLQDFHQWLKQTTT